MADGVVNTAYSERFRTSSAGESFTISNATKPDGTSWAGPTITHLGSGLYSLSFTPTAEGVYLATITGETSGESFGGLWDIGSSPTSTLRTTPISDDIEVTQGDSYLDADGRALIWSDDEWVDLTGATVTVTFISSRPTVALTPTVSSAGDTTQTISLELTTTQTRAMRNGTYTLWAVTAGGGRVTLAEGRVRVSPGSPPS